MSLRYIQSMQLQKKQKPLRAAGESLANLSVRLLHALKNSHVSQAELARRIGVKPQVISYLCSNQVTKSRFTYDIARALQISSEWLAIGSGPMRLNDDQQTLLLSSQRCIPLLTLAEIPIWLTADKAARQRLAITRWVLSDKTLGERGFALTLTDNAMAPRFEVGTHIFINPDITAKHNDYVLVFIAKQQHCFFRQYNAEQRLLVPQNAEPYKVISLGKTDKILGVMVEARWYDGVT